MEKDKPEGKRMSHKWQIAVALVIVCVAAFGVYFLWTGREEPIGPDEPVVPDRIFPVVNIIQYSDNYWKGDYIYCVAKKGEEPELDYSFLVIMDEEANIEYTASSSVYFDWLNQLNETHIFYKYDGRKKKSNVTDGIIWNMEDDTKYVIPNFADIFAKERGHHAMLVFEDRYVILGKWDGHDTIVEIDRVTGEILWRWCTDAVFEGPLTNDTRPHDFFHSNDVSLSLDGKYYYINMRTANSFVKINIATGMTEWMCGEYGGFTLLNSTGGEVSNLWYKSHIIKEVEPNVFLMFDNDQNNATKIALNETDYPDLKGYDGQSRIIQITVDKDSRTAWLSWNYTPSRKYYCAGWGDIDVLPNGNYLAIFGGANHKYYLDEGEESFGAALIELTRDGTVVREYRFPFSYGIYRMQTLD